MFLDDFANKLLNRHMIRNHPELERLPPESRHGLILHAMERIHFTNRTASRITTITATLMYPMAVVTLGVFALSRMWGFVSLGMVALGFLIIRFLRKKYLNSDIRTEVRRLIDELDHPTCAACGYNLTGNESKICPECGQPFTPPDS